MFNLMRTHRRQRPPNEINQLRGREIDDKEWKAIFTRRGFVGAVAATFAAGLIGILPEWVKPGEKTLLGYSPFGYGTGRTLPGRHLKDIKNVFNAHGDDVNAHGDVPIGPIWDSNAKRRAFVVQVLISDRLLDEDGGVHRASLRQMIADDVAYATVKFLEEQAEVTLDDHQAAREIWLAAVKKDKSFPQTGLDVLDDYMSGKREAKRKGLL